MTQPTRRTPFDRLPFSASLRRLGTTGAVANIAAVREHRDQQEQATTQRLGEIATTEIARARRAHLSNPSSTS